MTDHRPNVLLVLTDQQRWDTVGAYGTPMELTPTLDDLAREGVRFEHAFTPQPLCGPARAATLTGQHATESGVWRDGLSLAADTRTIAHELSDAGYDVGFVGNWHLAATFENPVPDERRGGFDDYWVAADVPEFTTRPTEGTLYDADDQPVTYDDQYRADAFTDHAVDALSTLSEPFCLVLSYLEPHDQNDMWTFVPPEGYGEHHSKQPFVPPDLQGRPGEWYEQLPNYYGMVERLDECLARLLETLDALAVRDHTLVGFTADHGCHFRTRPGEYKRSPHESSIRVPLVLSGPGFERCRVVDDLVSLVDLAPTILDAAGLDIPGRMHGHSLYDVLAGDASRDAVFVQVSEAEICRALRTERWKYAVSAPVMNGWRGGMGDPQSDTYVERYLYDLQSDPTESVNLVGRADYHDVTVALRDRLRDRIAAVEGEEPTINPFKNPGYREY